MSTENDTSSEENGLNDEMPEWLPEEYDIDAPLRERIRIMADIEGGIELHAADERGVIEVVGTPHNLSESVHGVIELKAGGRPDNWNYEIVVPAEDTDRGAFIRKVNPSQPYEDYLDTRRIALDDVDLRIYGVDHGLLDEKHKEATA